jgi:DDE superfamily endonuclease
LQPHRQKNWCLGVINAVFLSLMEQILKVYELPYDEDYPVICYDEKPCALYGDITPPIAPQPCEWDERGEVKKKGRPKKIDCEYQRNGACSVLVAVQPLKGWRKVKTTAHRKADDFTQFMKELALQFPKAKKIRLVMDNLNTHAFSSFYKSLTAEDAFELTQKFEFYFTPVKASWLNMAEIELSALSRICLDRRLDTLEKLDTEIQQLVKERNADEIKINWQFTNDSARIKMNRHYAKINPANLKNQPEL